MFGLGIKTGVAEGTTLAGSIVGVRIRTLAVPVPWFEGRVKRVRNIVRTTDCDTTVEIRRSSSSGSICCEQDGCWTDALPIKSLQPTATALWRGMSAGNTRSVTPAACASCAPSLLTSPHRESFSGGGG